MSQTASLFGHGQVGAAAGPLVHKSPYYMASSTSGTALGAGKCSVAYFVNGKVVATREFSVSER